jgi:hypothetical protein
MCFEFRSCNSTLSVSFYQDSGELTSLSLTFKGCMLHSCITLMFVFTLIWYDLNYWRRQKNTLVAWNRVLFEKMIVARVVKNFLPFMEPVFALVVH